MEDKRKIVSLLRRAHPGRRDFSEEEMSFAERLLDASRESGPKSGMLPTKFVEIGHVVTVGGYTYRCIERPREIVIPGGKVVSLTCPADVCVGCDFSVKYRNCSCLQCSYADRRDRANVWFIEVADE